MSTDPFLPSAKNLFLQVYKVTIDTLTCLSIELHLYIFRLPFE